MTRQMAQSEDVYFSVPYFASVEEAREWLAG